MAPRLHQPAPGHSETGLRGLTAIPGPGGEVLLAAIEGNASRLVRIDPRDGGETTELDVDDFLGGDWGMRPNYTIVAYNNMTKIGGSLLMGVMAFIPRTVSATAGHALVDVGYGSGRKRRLVSRALTRRALCAAPGRGRFRTSAGRGTHDRPIAVRR
jgi:hypothetical protein